MLEVTVFPDPVFVFSDFTFGFATAVGLLLGLDLEAFVGLLVTLAFGLRKPFVFPLATVCFSDVAVLDFCDLELGVTNSDVFSKLNSADLGLCFILEVVVVILESRLRLRSSRNGTDTEEELLDFGDDSRAISSRCRDNFF